MSLAAFLRRVQRRKAGTRHTGSSQPHHTWRRNIEDTRLPPETPVEIARLSKRCARDPQTQSVRSWPCHHEDETCWPLAFPASKRGKATTRGAFHPRRHSGSGPRAAAEPVDWVSVMGVYGTESAHKMFPFWGRRRTNTYSNKEPFIPSSKTNPVTEMLSSAPESFGGRSPRPLPAWAALTVQAPNRGDVPLRARKREKRGPPGTTDPPWSGKWGEMRELTQMPTQPQGERKEKAKRSPPSGQRIHLVKSSPIHCATSRSPNLCFCSSYFMCI